MGQLIVNQLFQQGGIGKEFLPKNRTERETNLSGYCLVQFEWHSYRSKIIKGARAY